jgi:hypothetical protein
MNIRRGDVLLMYGHVVTAYSDVDSEMQVSSVEATGETKYRDMMNRRRFGRKVVVRGRDADPATQEDGPTVVTREVLWR